ncbi:hypothetical protein CN172_01045 [Sinorhizobium meliloti]|uniref:hypothetical protein n=1 Tax=Rhizobium meliloti TaxID=382 RepID=UPI000FD83DE1|nr:hypothetical protein [Sinorhizobium meliloti]RVE99711.1 hypothetical protein CN232_16460 [Sinorhizobium meliloti]RVH42642.1 hypothetical protein CN208_17735 [Sinorhizobium meliloti]RVK21656.1 hypothetical protein CN172_01045 [Sinorhizobium meliloti]
MPSSNYSAESRLHETITAMRLVMPDVLERERELARVKWYAYRFMSPLEATRHFAELYKAGFKAYVRRERDLEEAERVQGLGTRIFGRPNSSLTELWKARQRADELCLPYDLLIEFGFHFAARRVWKNAPRPAQLFGSKDSDVAWPIEIEKWLEDRLPLAVERLDGLPQYRIENYRGFPVQDEFRGYLLDLMNETTGPWSRKLERQCVTKRHLPFRLAMRLVPKGMRASVIRHLRSEIEAGSGNACRNERLPDVAFAPTCFGIPVAHDKSSQACATCGVAELCSRTAKGISAHMLNRHGNLSPLEHSRKTNTREKTKLRVRKLRQRRKAANSGAGTPPQPEAGQM